MRRFSLLLLPLASACIADDAMINPDTGAIVDACDGAPAQSLRVASYNIKSGAQTSLAEVGDAIVAIAPDVLALQEVNVDLNGPADADQPRVLAGRLGYPFVYAAALCRGLTHTYGIALISRFPFKHIGRINLRSAGAAEPRVAIDARICVGGAEVRVLATHADVWQPAPNLRTLAAALDETVTEKTIVLGDLNVQPSEGTAQETIGERGLVDLVGKYAEGPTFWSDGKRLDYLFVDRSLEAAATGATIGSTHASDHLPVWADFRLQP